MSAVGDELESGGLQGEGSRSTLAEVLASDPRAMRDLSAAIMPMVVSNLEQIARRNQNWPNGGDSRSVASKGDDSGRVERESEVGSDRSSENIGPDPEGDAAGVADAPHMSLGAEARRPANEACVGRSGNEAGALSSGNEASRIRSDNQVSTCRLGNEAYMRGSGSDPQGAGTGVGSLHASALSQAGPSHAQWWPSWHMGGPSQPAPCFAPQVMQGCMPAVQWGFPGASQWGITPSLPQDGPSSSGWKGDWTSQPTGSGARKRPRPPESCSSVATSEDEIDPFISRTERRELLSGDDSGSDSESGEEVDLTGPAAKKFVPCEETIKLLKSVSAKPMKNERRRKVIDKLPIPACDMAHPPKLNDSVACLVPKSAKSFDKYLSKLQRFTMDGMGPIVWLWNQMQQGGVEEDCARKALQASLLLLGNASSHFNVERRKAIMKHLNADIRHLAEAEFPDSGPYLFGEEFGKRAKATAEDIRALKGAQVKGGTRFSGSGGSNQRKWFTPQSRRHSWGITQSQKSVFSRLDRPGFQSNRKSNKPPKQAPR